MAKDISRLAKKAVAAKKASASIAKKRITKHFLDKANAKLKAAHEKKEHEYAAEIKKLDGKEKELLDRLKEFEEKKEKVAADYGKEDVCDDDLIEINAGGKIVSARRGVLCRLTKGKRLEALFSGRWDKKLQRDSSGRIFLNVSGDCFQAIVDYLNEMTISAEEDQPLPPSTVGGGENRQMLYDHLQLFGLPYAFTSDSNIIKESTHAAAIDNWLEEDGSAGLMSLLYCSSRDGVSAERFHNKCDGNGDSDKDRTLVLIETEEGGIVGGYSNAPWESSRKCKEADKAFLFALSGFSVSSPCKMKLKEDASGTAVYCSEGSGPTFGGGVRGDFHVMRSSVWLWMGRSYQGGPTEELNSDRNYRIKEMEVFQVSDTCTRKAHQRSQNEDALVDRFTGEVNDAINEKWLKLQELEEEVLWLEESFKDEENFIDSIGGGVTNDIITLNVSGTRMATNRAALMFAQESVLAQQFDDTKWTEQGCKDMRVKVKDWEPYEVARWVKSIEGAQEDVSHLFETNGINGTELIALDKEGLKMLGVTRVGTICLLSDEISALKKTSSEGMETLIEHSPYCFGKILDYL